MGLILASGRRDGTVPAAKRSGKVLCAGPSFVDWESGAAATVALLRTEAGREPGDQALRELIGELSTASAEFSVFWASHDIRIRHEGVKRLRHPQVGELELTYQSVDLPTGCRASQDLSLYTAEPGTAHEERLRLLASWHAPSRDESARTSTGPDRGEPGVG